MFIVYICCRNGQKLNSSKEKNESEQQPTPVANLSKRKNEQVPSIKPDLSAAPVSVPVRMMKKPVSSLKRRRSKNHLTYYAFMNTEDTENRKTVAFKNNKPTMIPPLSSSLPSSSHIPPAPAPKRRLETIMHSEPTKTKECDVYVCPYKWCKRPSFTFKKSFFDHIRKEHYASFPPFSPDKTCVFQKLSGKKIGFDEQSRDSVLDGQEIYSEDLRIHFYCPYKSCTVSEYSRQNLFTHIRDHHYQDFPQFLEFNRLAFKNAAEQAIRFDENSRNTLEDGDPIHMVRASKADHPDSYYCPFQGCEGGNGIFYFSDLYKHFRRIHQCKNLPQRQKLATVSKKFFLKTKAGSILNMTDSSCKSTVNKNETLFIEFVD
ncbi:hypothetical protein BDA99DRAFT_280732 [Phascolomyces articulosus]|uniref:C2H2-type domain-containing protein n=1 Tax=Phascolomyces articulosus TaxID=60185 RepID=A0AAD5K7N4_9FUNG|nr:hypothetical protein BDA99DRAFT_280732 [Phascolomyces articulosus]